MSRYEEAKKMYAAYGVDAEAAIERLKEIPLSVHCWQGDDVLGFDGSDSLDGGIQTTGNYPGKATGFEQLKEDIIKAFSLMPGKKRLNLHASYAVLGADKGKVDRDAYTYQYFEPWVKFAKENGIAGHRLQPDVFCASQDERRSFPLVAGRTHPQILGEPRQGLFENRGGAGQGDGKSLFRQYLDSRRL